MININFHLTLYRRSAQLSNYAIIMRGPWLTFKKGDLGDFLGLHGLAQARSLFLFLILPRTSICLATSSSLALIIGFLTTRRGRGVCCITEGSSNPSQVGSNSLLASPFLLHPARPRPQGPRRCDASA